MALTPFWLLFCEFFFFFLVSFLSCPFALLEVMKLIVAHTNSVLYQCLINLPVLVTNLSHWLAGETELILSMLLTTFPLNQLLGCNMTGIGTLCLFNGPLHVCSYGLKKCKSMLHRRTFLSVEEGKHWSIRFSPNFKQSRDLGVKNMNLQWSDKYEKNNIFLWWELCNLTYWLRTGVYMFIMIDSTWYLVLARYCKIFIVYMYTTASLVSRGLLPSSVLAQCKFRNFIYVIIKERWSEIKMMFFFWQWHAARKWALADILDEDEGEISDSEWRSVRLCLCCLWVDL